MTGSGTFTTAAARLNTLGWYAYVQVVPGDANHIGLTTPCRAPNESFRVETQPRVQTIVSSTRVQPGTALHDRVMVSGLASQRVTVQAALYGPFAARTGSACTGTPVWTGSLEVDRDGEYRTGDYTVTLPGYYTYVESIAASGFVRAARTTCGAVAETTVVVGSPRVTTTVSSQQTRPGATITDRVVVTGLGRLSATVPTPRVVPVWIDTTDSVLAVPPFIARTSWWQDGMAPGAKAGAILIAGHVDSARAGPDAFFRLREANAGDRVQVTTRNGRTFTYRVVSVARYPKSRLPTSVYSSAGSPRLVLVTCGGPFVPATGRYRDNIVLTAVPA